MKKKSKDATQIQSKITKTFISLWPYTTILIFFRIFILRVNIAGIEKNFNLALIGLAILVFIGLLSLVLEYKLKIIKVLIPYTVYIFFIWIINLFSVYKSVNPALSKGMLISLTLSYTLGGISVGWLLLVKKYIKIKRLHKVATTALSKFIIFLSLIPIYDLLLSIIQMIYAYFFRSTYKTLPVIVKRLMNNGYFLDNVPPHQFLVYKLKILRPVGIMGDSNVNAMLMSIIFLILLSVFLLVLKYLNSETKLKRYVEFGIFASLLVIILDISRSASLGFIVIFILLLLLLWIPLYKRLALLDKVEVYKLGLLILLIFGFIIGGVLFTPKLRHYTFSYIQNITDLKHDSSANTHFRLINQALSLAKEHQYTPWGLGTFPYVYKTYVNSRARNGASPHCAYATILMEQGLVGFIIYLLVLFGIWINFIKSLFNARSLIIHEDTDIGMLNKDKPNWTKFTEVLSAVFNLAIPLLTLSTIFYYGFWDISVWWWGIHTNNNKIEKVK